MKPAGLAALILCTGLAACSSTARVTTTSSPSTAATTLPTTTTTPTASTTTTSRANATTATVGGLTVTLTGTHAGQRSQFTIKAEEVHARGALAYRLSYGDGAIDQNLAPQFCVAGGPSAQSQTWQPTHHYPRRGSYTVTVTVTANCTTDRASTTLAWKP